MLAIGCLHHASQRLVMFIVDSCLCVCTGQRVVVVRCEGINISGNFYRNKCKLCYNDLQSFNFFSSIYLKACCVLKIY
jgi:hypothetical protein